MAANRSSGMTARARSLMLVALMIASTTIVAGQVQAGSPKQFRTAANPQDIAAGDFDCDGDEDLVMANGEGFRSTVLWNDDGDFSERTDIWVSRNASQDAWVSDLAMSELVRVGELTGDSAPDYVLYNQNWQSLSNPNVTSELVIIENDGCSLQGFSIGDRIAYAQQTSIIAMEVADVNVDGDDDIVVLARNSDTGVQDIRTYIGPNYKATGNPRTQALPADATSRFFDLKLGDYGEGSAGIGNCDDLDIWLLHGPGFVSQQGFNAGNFDNVSVLEFNCIGVQNFAPWVSATQKHGPYILNGTRDIAEGFDVADIDSSVTGVDVIAITQGWEQNVTYMVRTGPSSWGAARTAYIDLFVGWDVEIEDFNNDNEPDFLVATEFSATQIRGSLGQQQNIIFFDDLTTVNTVQLIISDGSGSGGHLPPQSYDVGRRPTQTILAQLSGGNSSPLDLAVATDDALFSLGWPRLWTDSMGLAGQWDGVTIIEMNLRDIELGGLSIGPAAFGIVGEGRKNLNVTLRNAGLNSLTGGVDLDVVLKEVVNGSNSTVYMMDWDNVEDASGCNGGCLMSIEEYLGNTSHWHEETNHTVNGDNQSARVINPTDFMWSGIVKNNGTEDITGYGANWEEAVLIEDVDLTGADAAYMSAEIFLDSEFDALYFLHNGNPRPYHIMDHGAFVEVYSNDTGWEPLRCPIQARRDGLCVGGNAQWGGYDFERWAHDTLYDYMEIQNYPSHYSGGTRHGWMNFTDEGVDPLGAFDLSRYAGDTVDIRFRFRSGMTGSVSDENSTLWSDLDGMAIDNISIWKETSTYNVSNQQSLSQSVSLTGLIPGDEQVFTLTANLTNDTVYEITASATATGFTDDYPANDDLRGRIKTLNLYDPAIDQITSFQRGELYAQGALPIEVMASHRGNTLTDFDIEAEVFVAQPTNLLEEQFESVPGYSPKYTDNSNQLGEVYNDSSMSSTFFGTSSYWFGHPESGYGDDWDENFSLHTIDMRSLGGNFVHLSFDYYADMYYLITQDGQRVATDQASLRLSWTESNTTYAGIIVGSWTDYDNSGLNENFTCDAGETERVGDIVDPAAGRRGNVFFNTDGFVRSTAVDLTHVLLYNSSHVDFNRLECRSLLGSEVNVRFHFTSDGSISGNDGLRGWAVDNISVDEFTYTSDGTYTTTVTGMDAQERRTVAVASHDFFSGIYRVDVRSIFDNVTQGTGWQNEKELSLVNNRDSVVFKVAATEITFGQLRVLEGTYPIDELGHTFSVPAVNGVLGESYDFHVSVIDQDTGTEVHSMVIASEILEPHQRTNAARFSWAGWVDGHTYLISFSATTTAGVPAGNERNVTVTFADMIDVAILSNPTEQGRLDNVKADLRGLGMTYTQFTQTHDWDDFLTSDWMEHYEKILIPWQSKTTVQNQGYFDSLKTPRIMLQTYMKQGGTIQMHLAPFEAYSTNALPFHVEMSNRLYSDNNSISSVDMLDPYHPLLDNVNPEHFGGFHAGNWIAQGAINTQQVQSDRIPSICKGLMRDGGSFQNIMSEADMSEADAPKNSVLATCSTGQGGMILTTVDVEFVSARHDSKTMPLLGNLLQFQVTPYPATFGVVNASFDMTINGEVPTFDQFNRSYATRLMKSNTTLDFAFTALESGLMPDWEIDGPTDWDGASMHPSNPRAFNNIHTNNSTPSMTFCKTDTSSATGCQQGVEWTVTMYLHDAAGHARVATIVLLTDDVGADESIPVANVSIIDRIETKGQISWLRTRQTAGQDWDVYQIKLREATNDLMVHFTAENSSDPDSFDGSHGLKRYEWRIINDYPYGGTPPLEGKRDDVAAGEAGTELYFHRFRNVTVSGTVPPQENLIRLELIVYDRADRSSVKSRMYFVVVPADFGDEAPVVDITSPANLMSVKGDMINITGTVESGVENPSDSNGVMIEVSLDRESFNLTQIPKYELTELGVFNRTSAPLHNGEMFTLSLEIGDMYGNISQPLIIHIRYYEDDGSRYDIYDGRVVSLVARDDCMLDPSRPECQVVPTAPGEDSENGSNFLFSLGPMTVGISAVAIIVALGVVLLFVLRGGGGQPDLATAELDPMEAYVQQLIVQGYPEETARAYAEQYRQQFQG